MSVGFVSTAAGVLLTAQFLRYLNLGGMAAIPQGIMAMATFGRAKLRTMQIGRDQVCDCVPRLREGWDKCWPNSYRT
jgi:hypothetical protein